MAKISNPIMEFADIIKRYGLERNEILTASNKVVKRFIRLAKEVPDVRLQGMIDYPLKEILLIAFFAMLSGAETWTQIAMFGIKREKWLKAFLKYKNGTPSHDTFRRVFSLISPNIFQTLIVDFLMDNMNRIKASLGIEDKGVRLINIDGKQARGTGRKSGKDGAFPNFQALNIYDASNRICLVMKDIESKTNEIPAAQAALELLNVKGAIVTCDALNTQKETMALVAGKGRGGDYVAALKKNHHNLYEELELFFSHEKKKEIKNGMTGFVTSLDKAHSKVERRNFYVTTDVKWYQDRGDWAKLRAFVCYEKILHDTQTGIDSCEIRYYISSVNDAELCAEAIRGHWAVENVLHWHLDVSFADDDDMTTDKNAYYNFTAMRRMALTLCKISQAFMKCSVKNIRWLIAIEHKQVLGEILGTLDDAYLEQALREANTRKPNA
jgi:predicted transposase YbfD/YdcC